MKTCLQKFAIILCVLGIASAGTAAAQSGNDDRHWRQGPPSVEDVLARMSETLNLSDQQVVDLLVVLQEHAAQRAALHEQSMALIGPEVCAQKAAAEEDILAILTPEQTDLFLEIKENRRAKAGEGNRGRGQRGPDCSQYEAEG